jgi:hypothetical protein
VIHAYIEDAMVLVVDTPDSPQSGWMFEENNAAIARWFRLCRPSSATTKGFLKFLSLASLPSVRIGEAPLSDQEWTAARAEIEQVMLSGYRRRLAIVSRAQREFTNGLYKWSELDHELRWYRAFRRRMSIRSEILRGL